MMTRPNMLILWWAQWLHSSSDLAKYISAAMSSCSAEILRENPARMRGFMYYENERVYVLILVRFLILKIEKCIVRCIIRNGVWCIGWCIVWCIVWCMARHHVKSDDEINIFSIFFFFWFIINTTNFHERETQQYELSPTTNQLNFPLHLDIWFTILDIC
jgi:hypothetical protein